ncbi:UNVERIFIED_CONTAM: hypothetical protein Slati_4002600 [Sesamum latifolium]|uniref:Uncharacterized protein n=1 Tax=Sesamum latifolium TaxID=2727402 RepID=A0AAW2TQJ3_9LAMI
MASKNQNKAPPSPSNSKYSVDEVSVDKRRRIGNPKMPPNTVTKTQTRQAFSVVNGGQDLPPTSGPPSTCGSDCGVVGFTKRMLKHC